MELKDPSGTELPAMSDDLTISTLSIINRITEDNKIIGTGVFCHPTTTGEVRLTVFPIYSGEFFTHLKNLYHLIHYEENVPLDLQLIMADPETVLEIAHDTETPAEILGTRLTIDNLQKTHDTVIRNIETMRKQQ